MVRINRAQSGTPVETQTLPSAEERSRSASSAKPSPAADSFTKQAPGARPLSALPFFSGIQGRFEGHVAPTFLPQQALAAILPPRVTLAPDSQAPAGQHSVTFAFENQYDAKPAFFGRPIPDIMAIDYDQFVLVIPEVYVTGKDGAKTGPYLFMRHFYVSDWLMTLTGRALYTSERDHAVIQSTAAHYEVSDKNKKLAWADFKPVEKYDQAAFDAAFQAQFARMQRPVLMEKGDDLVAVDFTWGKDGSPPTAKPVSINLGFDSAMTPGLDGRSIDVPALGAAATGAFVIKSYYRLSPPKKV